MKVAGLTFGTDLVPPILNPRHCLDVFVVLAILAPYLHKLEQLSWACWPGAARWQLKRANLTAASVSQVVNYTRLQDVFGYLPLYSRGATACNDFYAQLRKAVIPPGVFLNLKQSYPILSLGYGRSAFGGYSYNFMRSVLDYHWDGVPRHERSLCTEECATIKEMYGGGNSWNDNSQLENTLLDDLQGKISSMEAEDFYYATPFYFEVCQEYWEKWYTDFEATVKQNEEDGGKRMTFGELTEMLIIATAQDAPFLDVLLIAIRERW